LIAAAEGSLWRLGTEYIDLYQLPWPNYRVPIEESIGAMEELVDVQARLSDITLLELATLSSRGRIRLDISLESLLREVEARFIILPISNRE
jgi:hypothetical protein